MVWSVSLAFYISIFDEIKICNINLETNIFIVLTIAQVFIDERRKKHYQHFRGVFSIHTVHVVLFIDHTVTSSQKVKGSYSYIVKWKFCKVTLSFVSGWVKILKNRKKYQNVSGP